MSMKDFSCDERERLSCQSLKKLGWLVFLFSALFLANSLFNPPLTLADRLTSESYIIQFGNFNMGAGMYGANDPNSQYNVSYTLGQTGAGPYGTFGAPGSQYFVGAGFQYIYQIGTFSFTISDTDLDLGSLTPGVHNTAQNTLTISTRGAGGYTVYAYEQYRLALQGGLAWIKDTECDTGYACDVDSANLWIDQDEPGFGYNAQGNTVNEDFTADGNDSCDQDDECFRPFADISLGGTMQEIMSSNAIARNEEALITYKVGIGGTQPAGRYETGIVYVAVPGY